MVIANEVHASETPIKGRGKQEIIVRAFHRSIGGMNVSRTQTLRVLHTIGRLIPGGVELRTLELIRATGDNNIEHVVCITSGRKGTLDEQYKDAGAELHYMSIRSPLFALRFYRLLRTRTIDVVHGMLMYVSGYLLGIARLANVPKRIAHFQSDGSKQTPNIRGKITRAILRRSIDRHATDIVGLTPATLEIAWSREWHKDARCQIVVNGIPQSTPSKFVPPEFHPFLSQNIVVHAGRADLPTKNREKAITVFAEYLRLRPESVLIFIGRDGSSPENARQNLDKWRHLSNELGIADRVYFLGEKRSILPYFSSADILLFTSTLEGLPGVILEALSVGLPVLSSDVPGAIYISEENPTVQILDPEAPDKLWAEKLLDYQNKLDGAQRRHNRGLFTESKFDLDQALHGYIRLWRN